MASDLVGLVGIVVLAGGAYIVLTSDWAKQNLNGSNQDVLNDPGFTEGDTGTDAGNTSGSNCGQLCRDKNCSEYKANCSTGCKYCCGSGPNSPKCSGGSSKGGGTFTNGGCPAHAHTSNSTCVCDSGYKQSGTVCVSACPSGFTYSGGKCTCSRTSAGCGSGKVARLSNGKCVCTSCSTNYKVSGNDCVCGAIACCGGCPSGKRKVMNNGRCGCETIPSPTGGGGGSSGGSCPCKQGSKCSGFTGATCCAWRGANGGCSSGFKGVLHGAGPGCDCVRSSSYARALTARAYHARPNLRTSYRLSIG